MPAWVRWILAALGAAAVTGVLFVVIPRLMRIGTSEAGVELAEWQDAHPPEYGGAFLRSYDISVPLERVRNEDDRFSEDSNAFGFPYIVYESGMTRPDGPISRFADLPAWDGATISGSIDPMNVEIDLPIEAGLRSSGTDLSCIQNRMRASYPVAALEQELEGNVTVLYDLSEGGRAVNARVESASHPVFADHVTRQIADCGVDPEPVNRDLPFRLEYRLDP